MIARHRKIHLFDIDIPGKITFKESETLSPGEGPTVVDLSGYSLLQCVAACCSVLRRRAHGRRSLWVQCHAVCCSLLRCMHRAAIQARSRNGHIHGMCVMECVLWNVCYGMCAMGSVVWEVWDVCYVHPKCSTFMRVSMYICVSFRIYMGLFSYIGAPDVAHGCVLRAPRSD